MCSEKVVIVQRRLTHYRLPLFELIKKKLADRGIDLVLLVGEGNEVELKKGDAGDLEWAKPIPTFYFFKNKACIQWAAGNFRDSSLVVITQENKLLMNFWLLVKPRKYKLAFWGHGANFQSRHSNGFLERFKRWTTNKVDWWFAYTEMSADFIQAAAFPKSKTSVINNSVDTRALEASLESLDERDVQLLKDELGFSGNNIGLFIGSLYEDKKINLLLSSSERIKKFIPDFYLIIVGDGPLRSEVEQWCSIRPWGHCVGAKFDKEKTLYLSLATIMLNPGAVGLGILDSFVARVPMLTTDCKIHGPEISYLENGVNGVMTTENEEEFADACIALFLDNKLLSTLRDGCLESAKEYSLDNMAGSFVDGIVRCLGENTVDREVV